MGHPAATLHKSNDEAAPADAQPQREVLTYSALATFRRCKRLYHNKYIELMQPPRKRDALWFGTIIHDALALWLHLQIERCKFESQVAVDEAKFDNTIRIRVQNFISEQFDADNQETMPERTMALAMMNNFCSANRDWGYRPYCDEATGEFLIEKEIVGEIINPASGHQSKTFYIRGKVDAVVQDIHTGDLFLMEHKTASPSSVDRNYVRKLYMDTQIALYVRFLRKMGYPIKGVLYNILLKSGISMKAGETVEEHQARVTVQAAKNKGGICTAKRKMPELQKEFAARMQVWYEDPEHLTQVDILIADDRLEMVDGEIWDMTQEFLMARRLDRWSIDPGRCMDYHSECTFFEYCKSGFSIIVKENDFEVKDRAHTELSASYQT